MELQKSCYLDEAEIYNDFEIPPLTQTLESIERDFEKETFLKIETENRIIGSVRGHVDQDTCKIGRLVVNKNFRNQGLGAKLMQAIESKFDFVKRFELFTGHKSDKNLFLYNKLGYTEFQRQRINEKIEFVFLEKVNPKSGQEAST
ncbi:GNAT family N-acetyltransferase [Galbibacter sp. EGI 63066]|uniref:GNAT family N-acetyltransferase n=1 Tax=Galbibacter sp. EGI 63066 TaxID=2993559 RepID=UPI0022497A68|nr:GNAT family N-acetyltransferase [Galbibacter sp. EGI 63066]MCX2679953.1 GNAT family N-acetyltransferase [Galbibacter sp. EGI 63066]